MTTTDSHIIDGPKGRSIPSCIAMLWLPLVSAGMTAMTSDTGDRLATWAIRAEPNASGQAAYVASTSSRTNLMFQCRAMSSQCDWVVVNTPPCSEQRVYSLSAGNGDGADTVPLRAICMRSLFGTSGRLQILETDTETMHSLVSNGKATLSLTVPLTSDTPLQLTFPLRGATAAVQWVMRHANGGRDPVP